MHCVRLFSFPFEFEGSSWNITLTIGGCDLLVFYKTLIYFCYTPLLFSSHKIVFRFHPESTIVKKKHNVLPK